MALVSRSLRRGNGSNVDAFSSVPLREKKEDDDGTFWYCQDLGGAFSLMVSIPAVLAMRAPAGWYGATPLVKGKQSWNRSVSSS